MHVNHPKKLIFIHAPKTAGTSVAVAMGCEEKGFERVAHLTPSVARNYFFQDDWDLFFSFSIVRNPWQRYISLYRYQASEAYGDLTEGNLSHRLARNLSFDEWVTYNLGAKEKARWFGIPQSEWWNGVSKVYQLENLEELSFDLRNLLGNHVSIPKVNLSIGECPSLNSTIINFVSSIDSETIKKFGYKISHDNNFSALSIP